MKINQNIILSFGLALVLIFTGFTGSAYGVEIVAASKEAKMIACPSISAAGAVVLDGRTGRVLYEKDANVTMPMASTTKIMTAIVAIENAKMDELVNISEKAAKTEGSSIYLTPKEKVKMEDLLYGLMLQSGNDAAEAISEYFQGKGMDLIQMMNDRAKEMGATNTHFTNPSGLSEKEHYTTAYDLGTISFEAMKNETFQRIVSSKKWTAGRDTDQFNFFHNKNKVLYQYNGGTGIKIGYTIDAGRCLVASSQRDGVALICVVLGDHNWFDDAYKLMDYVYETYDRAVIAQKGEPIKDIAIKNGEKDRTGLVCSETFAIPIREDEKDKMKLQFDVKNAKWAPVQRGEKAGELKLYFQDRYMGMVDLIYREDIEKTKHFAFENLFNKNEK